MAGGDIYLTKLSPCRSEMHLPFNRVRHVLALYHMVNVNRKFAVLLQAWFHTSMTPVPGFTTRCVSIINVTDAVVRLHVGLFLCIKFLSLLNPFSAYSQRNVFNNAARVNTQSFCFI